MKLSSIKTSILVFVGFTLIAMSAIRATPAPQAALPNPILNFLGQEPFKTGGQDFIRYNYEVFNRGAYPKELFAAAPRLPPCGNNTKASRTWIDLYDQSGKRLNGFCALSSNKDLESIWFALKKDVVPPSYIYIEMNDRQTSTKYKSNLAESTL